MMKWIILSVIFCLTLRADEPAIHITCVIVGIHSEPGQTQIKTRWFDGADAVSEKLSTYDARRITNSIFLPKGRWLVYFTRGGRWHFLRVQETPWFQLRYVRGVSPPNLLLAIVRDD